MAITELQTRIALKYDSYTNWTSASGKSLVLLKGEVGICEAPSENNTAPTILFKVGDGIKTFEQLSWVSAKAADVYSWAKVPTAEEISLTINVGTETAPIELNTTLANWLRDYYTNLNETDTEIQNLKEKVNVPTTVSEAILNEIENLNSTTTGNGKFVTNINQANGKVSIVKGNITKGDITSDVLPENIPSAKILVENSESTTNLETWIDSTNNNIEQIQSELPNFKNADQVNSLIESKLSDLELEDNSISISGNTTTFINKASQINGKVSFTKASIPTGNATTCGIVKLGTQGGAATHESVENLTNQVNSTTADLDSRINKSESDISDLKTAIAGGVHFRGEVTYPENLLDSLNTQTVLIGNSYYEAIDGDVVIQNSKEFIWVTDSWKELGDLSRVGTLESKLDSLDYTDTGAVESTFVTKVTQTNGQIAVTHKRPDSDDITHSNSTVKDTLDSQDNRLIALEDKLINVDTVESKIESSIASALDALEYDASAAPLTGKSTTFLVNAYQSNGKVSFVKAQIPTAQISTAGITTLGAPSGAAKFETVETVKSTVNNTITPKLSAIEQNYIRYNDADQKLYIGNTTENEITIIFDCGTALDLV